MSTKLKEYMETPTESIEIKSTSEVDVTNYAKAQVVDSNLICSNIKEDVNILGVIGTANTIDTVSSVPSERQTDVIYNTSDKSYYAWVPVTCTVDDARTYGYTCWLTYNGTVALYDGRYTVYQGDTITIKTSGAYYNSIVIDGVDIYRNAPESIVYNFTIPENHFTIQIRDASTNFNYMTVEITTIPEYTPYAIDNEKIMSSLLYSSNVGLCYEYTGTSGTYIKNDLYVVEQDPSVEGEN